MNAAAPATIVRPNHFVIMFIVIFPRSDLLRSQRVVVGFAGADADDLIDRGHEDLSVSDLSGTRRLDDRLDRLVSDRVGCQEDLVTDGETGWVFRSDDPADLRRSLAIALAADLAPFRARVLARISNHTYAVAADGLKTALRLEAEKIVAAENSKKN